VFLHCLRRDVNDAPATTSVGLYVRVINRDPAPPDATAPDPSLIAAAAALVRRSHLVNLIAVACIGRGGCDAEDGAATCTYEYVYEININNK